MILEISGVNCIIGVVWWEKLKESTIITLFFWLKFYSKFKIIFKIWNVRILLIYVKYDFIEM